MFLLIASEIFSRVIGSSFVSGSGSRYESFQFTHNLGERIEQVWRDNSSRVGIDEKNSTYAVRQLGTIIEAFLCPIRSKNSEQITGDFCCIFYRFVDFLTLAQLYKKKSINTSDRYCFKKLPNN